MEELPPSALVDAEWGKAESATLHRGYGGSWGGEVVTFGARRAFVAWKQSAQSTTAKKLAAVELA